MSKVHIITTDREKLEVLNQMRKENLLSTIMYTWSECSDEDWLTYLREAICLTVYDPTNGKRFGMAWFDNIQGRTAYSNYLLFKEYQNQAIIHGKVIVDWMVTKMKMKMLLGVSPKPYRHSRNILKAWGYEETLTLPDACYMAKFRKHVDGILYVRKS